MFENIKLILGLTDNKYDELINLYILKFTNVVLNYCNLTDLNLALESFIEDKVVSIVKNKVSGSGGTENTGEIKAISRGDTKIEYNVGAGAIITDNSKGAILTESDKKYLDTFKSKGWRLL